jgi:hypothetical protein
LGEDALCRRFLSESTVPFGLLAGAHHVLASSFGIIPWFPHI